jgi:pimeloyl-ACP methyl ester carboxylesterase
MDTLHIEQPVICGLSMGGYIALRAVEKEEKRFSGLILCDTRSEDDNNEGKLKRSNAIDKINVDGLEAFVNDFVPGCFHPKAEKLYPEILDAQLKIAKSHNSLGVKGALIAMLSRRNTTKYLEEIKVPVLLLVGNKDALTPPALMKKMKKRIKKSKLYQVPKAGHMSVLENAEFVNSKIENFLAKNFANEK